jgi:hypothetical protein
MFGISTLKKYCKQLSNQTTSKPPIAYEALNMQTKWKNYTSSSLLGQIEDNF